MLFFFIWIVLAVLIMAAFSESEDEEVKMGCLASLFSGLFFGWIITFIGFWLVGVSPS